MKKVPHIESEPRKAPILLKSEPVDLKKPEEFVPKFVANLPSKLKIHEGEPIKLSCQVEGNPKPTVYILENKKFIKNLSGVKD